MARNQDQHLAVNPQLRLGQRLHAFSNTISANYYSRTELPFGISLAEWRVLQSVINSPAVSQGDIAAAHGLNAMTVSRAVAGLRRKGLIETEPNPDDRRRVMLTVTGRGKEIGADISARATQMYAHVFSELTEDEVDQLDALMARLNAHIHSVELPEQPEPSRDWAAVFANDDSASTKSAGR